MVEIRVRRLGRPNKSGKSYRPAQTEEQRNRARARNREWRKQNRTKLTQYMREWRAKNSDHHRRYARERYYEKPPSDEDRIKRRMRTAQWAKDNPARRRAQNKKWKAANPDRAAKATARWKQRHPEKATALSRANSRNRRAAKRRGTGRHTHADVVRILEDQRGRCAYCPRSIRAKYHVDHIVPLSKGGSNAVRNIQLTCESCNLKKHAHDPIDFARSLGRLL